MKAKHFLTILLFWINTSILFAQEWKTLTAYKIETGNTILQPGCWLRSDRKNQSEIWQKANVFNLQQENGYLKYQSIKQISDFYHWFDLEIKKKGHEIRWIGIASIATAQLSKTDNFFIRNAMIRDEEIVQFANEGSKAVLHYSFPLLFQIFSSPEVIKGAAAKRWDLDFGKKEQCEIIDFYYKKLSPKSLKKLERMAKGKGFFYFGVPKKIKFEGNLENCNDRFEHGLQKMIPYYLTL